jgi:hypothetical protein
MFDYYNEASHERFCIGYVGCSKHGKKIICEDCVQEAANVSVVISKMQANLPTEDGV